MSARSRSVVSVSESKLTKGMNNAAVHCLIAAVFPPLPLCLDHELVSCSVANVKIWTTPPVSCNGLDVAHSTESSRDVFYHLDFPKCHWTGDHSQSKNLHPLRLTSRRGPQSHSQLPLGRGTHA